MYRVEGCQKNKIIKLFCTATEKSYIDLRARAAGLSASAYIRELGLKDYPNKPKTLPPEVMAFNGQLAQLTGSLELIARRRLDGDDLNALERAELQALARQVKQ